MKNNDNRKKEKKREEKIENVLKKVLQWFHLISGISFNPFRLIFYKEIFLSICFFLFVKYLKMHCTAGSWWFSPSSGHLSSCGQRNFDFLAAIWFNFAGALALFTGMWIEQTVLCCFSSPLRYCGFILWWLERKHKSESFNFFTFMRLLVLQHFYLDTFGKNFSFYLIYFNFHNKFWPEHLLEMKFAICLCCFISSFNPRRSCRCCCLFISVCVHPVVKVLRVLFLKQFLCFSFKSLFSSFYKIDASCKICIKLFDFLFNYWLG